MRERPGAEPPAEPDGRRFRVSMPGRPDTDAVLSVDGAGWSVSVVPWAGEAMASAPVTVRGTSRDGLAALRLLTGSLSAGPRTSGPAGGHAATAASPPVAAGAPVVYHLGSHGLIHQLNLLGNSLQYCLEQGARLVPALELCTTWRGVAFHDVFAPRSAAFPTLEEHRALLDELPARLGLPIATYRDISHGFAPTTDGDCVIFHGTLADLDVPGLPWGRPLPPGGALLTGGAPWPPPGVPNGWIVAMQGITLSDRVRDEISHRARQLPARYIGVHFRNTDSLSSLSATVARVREAARASGIVDVVWATDDADSLAEAVRKLPGLRVLPFSVIPSVRGTGARGLHFLSDERLTEAGFARIDLQVAALMDLYALIRSEVFVPSESLRGMPTSWGGVVQHLRDNPALAEGFFGLPTRRVPAAAASGPDGNAARRLSADAERAAIDHSLPLPPRPAGWYRPPTDGEIGSVLERFDARRVASELPGKWVIAFSLYGDLPMYTEGALKNARIAARLFPEFVCRFYVGASVPDAVLRTLAEMPNVELVDMASQPERPSAMFWRFLATADPDVDVLLVRDADSRLNLRDRAAVNEWLESGRRFHIMRDANEGNHRAWMLGGMWGCRTSALRHIHDLIAEAGAYEESKGIDQQFLARHVYPEAIASAIVHDECTDLEPDDFDGKRPFPLPRRNAWDHVGAILTEDDD